jgi:catechol 2,3-dioxygenase-like lactoylglutathione lyase family enzyme
MIDHIGIPVSDLGKSKKFFSQALAPLGYTVLMDVDGAAGLGSARPDFWIAKGNAQSPTHICFAAPTRAVVDAFYKAAIAAGGRDNGAPGLRKQYHPTYYGAFVLDPDGNNVEAVCHAPA